MFVTVLARVSVLYREPKLLKAGAGLGQQLKILVSVLYREPKLLKVVADASTDNTDASFSALP